MASWFSSLVTRTQAHQYTASITASRLNIKKETRQRKTKVVGHCGYSGVDKYKRPRLEKELQVRNIFAGVDPTLSSTVTSCHEIRPSARRDAEACGENRLFCNFTKCKYLFTHNSGNTVHLESHHSLFCDLSHEIKQILISFGQESPLEMPHWKTSNYNRL